MTLEIRLRDEATDDLAEASSWYEQQIPGLGDEFLTSVLAFLETIPDNPSRYPIVHKDVRRALMPRFPFGIFYGVEDKFILIYAVMHGSRNPSRWQERT